MAKTVRRVKRKTGRRTRRKYTRCKTKKRINRKYNRKSKHSKKKSKPKRLMMGGGDILAEEELIQEYQSKLSRINELELNKTHTGRLNIIKSRWGRAMKIDTGNTVKITEMGLILNQLNSLIRVANRPNGGRVIVATRFKTLPPLGATESSTGTGSGSEPPSLPAVSDSEPEQELEPSSLPDVSGREPEQELEPPSLPDVSGREPEQELEPPSLPAVSDSEPEQELEPPSLPDVSGREPEQELEPPSLPAVSVREPEQEPEPELDPPSLQFISDEIGQLICPICLNKLFDDDLEIHRERCQKAWENNMALRLGLMTQDELEAKARSLTEPVSKLEGRENASKIKTGQPKIYYINIIIRNSDREDDWYMRWINHIDGLRDPMEKEYLTSKLKELLVIELPCGHGIHRCCAYQSQGLIGRPLTASKPKSETETESKPDYGTIGCSFGSMLWSLPRCPVCRDVIPQIVHLVERDDKATDRKAASAGGLVKGTHTPQLLSFLSPNLSTIEIAIKNCGEFGIKYMLSKLDDNSIAHLIMNTHGSREGFFDLSGPKFTEILEENLLSKLRPNAAILLDSCETGKLNSTLTPFQPDKSWIDYKEYTDRHNLERESGKATPLNYGIYYFKDMPFEEGQNTCIANELARALPGHVVYSFPFPTSTGHVEVDLRYGDIDKYKGTVLGLDEPKAALVTLIVEAFENEKWKGPPCKHREIRFRRYDLISRKQVGQLIFKANHYMKMALNPKNADSAYFLFNKAEKKYKKALLSNMLLDQGREEIEGKIKEAETQKEILKKEFLEMLSNTNLEELKIIAQDGDIDQQSVDSSLECAGPGFIYFSDEQYVHAFYHSSDREAVAEYLYVSPGATPKPLIFDEDTDVYSHEKYSFQDWEQSQSVAWGKI